MHTLTKQFAGPGSLLKGIRPSYQFEGRINRTPPLSVLWISAAIQVTNSRGHSIPVQGTVFASRSGKEEERSVRRSWTPGLAQAQASRGRRDKREHLIAMQCSGRNDTLSELSAIAEVSDISLAANSCILSTLRLELGLPSQEYGTVSRYSKVGSLREGRCSRSRGQRTEGWSLR
jgi:hypothetical protein